MNQKTIFQGQKPIKRIQAYRLNKNIADVDASPLYLVDV